MEGNNPITPISVFMMPKTPMVNMKINKWVRLVKRTTPIFNKMPPKKERGNLLKLKVEMSKKQESQIDFWTKEVFEKVISFIYKDDFYQHFLFISLWFFL
ncbi:hypothetical protein GCM10007968_24790 [Sporolactobacillus putidus]|uniref:Uncharacterized protein n=1 Tax=Sporolactobacillus putidus TaxID=492735 RepID=A0A917S6D5_9BACL|nr:hypothetical protein GCM10007968_24790 [Sporolactobacillus putidus]